MDANLTIASSTIRADGSRTHTLSAAPEDVTAGMMVEAASKLYRIREIADAVVVLDPQRRIPDATAVVASTNIEVRHDSPEHPPSFRDKSFWGPWTISFVEA